MPATKTIRKGDSFRIDVHSLVSGVHVGARVGVYTSDATKVAVRAIDEHSWRADGVLAGTATLTCTLADASGAAVGGAPTDTIAVTVIADDAVTDIRAEIIDV